MEAAGQGLEYVWGSLAGFAPGGGKRRGKQRKSKSEDWMTSWAPNEFRTGRTLTLGRKGEMVRSCLHFSATMGYGE